MKLNNSAVLKIVTIFLIIFSLAIILISKGQFYFAEWNQTIQIETTKSEVFDKYIGINNVSKIDRDSKVLLVQNKSLEDVKSDVTSKVSKDELKTITFKNILKSNKDYVFEAIIFSILFFVLLLIGLYYFIFKFKEFYDSEKFITFLKISISSFVITQLILFGFLLTLSRLYLVKISDVYLTIVSILVISFIFVFSLTLESHENADLSVVSKIERFIKNNFTKISLTTAAILAFASIAIGVSFVLTAFSLFLSIVLPFITIRFVIEFNKYINRRNNKNKNVESITTSNETKQIVRKNVPFVKRNKKHNKRRR